MALPALTGNELVAWIEQTSRGWRRLIAAHPEALQLPCNVRESDSVAQVLQHIVAVELRYAERLCGLAETPYTAIPCETSEALYAIHDRAMALLRQLENRDDLFWDESIAFVTRSAGSMTVSRRIIFVHLLMHSIRHYAQLATLLRQHGIPPDWPMDYLYMSKP